MTTTSTATTIRKLTPTPGEIRSRMGELQREMKLLRTLKRISEQARAVAPFSFTSAACELDEPERFEPAHTLDSFIEHLQSVRAEYGRGDMVLIEDDGIPIHGTMPPNQKNQLIVTSGYVEDPHITRLRRMAVWETRDDEDGR